MPMKIMKMHVIRPDIKKIRKNSSYRISPRATNGVARVKKDLAQAVPVRWVQSVVISPAYIMYTGLHCTLLLWCTPKMLMPLV